MSLYLVVFVRAVTSLVTGGVLIVVADVVAVFIAYLIVLPLFFLNSPKLLFFP